MKLSAKEFDELLSQVIEKLELPDDAFISHVVAEGGTPEPLTSLDDFGAKAKVQCWSPAQMAAAAAEAARVAAEEEQAQEEQAPQEVQAGVDSPDAEPRLAQLPRGRSCASPVIEVELEEEA